MLNFLLKIIVLIFALSFFSFAEEISQYIPEEDVAWHLNRHETAEKLTLADWRNMLVDLSEDMGKIGGKVLELNEMRPFYRLCMYYSVLGTLRPEDVESVKSANSSTRQAYWFRRLPT